MPPSSPRNMLAVAVLGVTAAGALLLTGLPPFRPAAPSPQATRYAYTTLAPTFDVKSSTEAISVPTGAEPQPTAAPSPGPPTAVASPIPHSPVPKGAPTPLPWLTPDAEAGSRSARVPILMYHYVGPVPAGAGPIRAGLTVLPEAFDAQLAYLASRGFTTISLYDLAYALALGSPLPDKPVILSFDDAYRDVHAHAFTRMAQYEFTGTVFVPTQLIDEDRPEYMNWDMLMELNRHGWSLEPHTKDHVQVSERDRDYVVYQALGSMQTLEAHLGYQPRFFSYPAGEYDDHVIGILKEIGFWGAVTTEAGVVHRMEDAYTWRRVRISGDTTLAEFVHFIENWDW